MPPRCKATLSPPGRSCGTARKNAQVLLVCGKQSSSVREAGGVDLQGRKSPVLERQSAGEEAEGVFKKTVLRLQVLRRQEDAFGPDDWL